MSAEKYSWIADCWSLVSGEQGDRGVVNFGMTVALNHLSSFVIGERVLHEGSPVMSHQLPLIRLAPS